MYVQNHIPVNVRNDLINPIVETRRLQIRLPYIKPIRMVVAIDAQPNVHYTDVLGFKKLQMQIERKP